MNTQSKQLATHFSPTCQYQLITIDGLYYHLMKTPLCISLYKLIIKAINCYLLTKAHHDLKYCLLFIINHTNRQEDSKSDKISDHETSQRALFSLTIIYLYIKGVFLQQVS